MSRTNEARHIEWHETYKCKSRLDASVCNNKQRWNNNKCRCEFKELIEKEICDKEFLWNPKNCDCECDKSCDVGEYLDYKNCKCANKLVDKLGENSSKNIDENKMIHNETLNQNVCNSCRVCIALLAIAFVIVIAIGGTFIYFHRCLKRDNIPVELSIKQINMKIRTYYFFNDMINIKNSDQNLLKIHKKLFRNIDISYIGYITIKNISDNKNIHSVNPLFIVIGKADRCFEDKNGNKYLVFVSTDKNKEYR